MSENTCETTNTILHCVSEHGCYIFFKQWHLMTVNNKTIVFLYLIRKIAAYQCWDHCMSIDIVKANIFILALHLIRIHVCGLDLVATQLANFLLRHCYCYCQIIFFVIVTKYTLFQSAV